MRSAGEFPRSPHLSFPDRMRAALYRTALGLRCECLSCMQSPLVSEVIALAQPLFALDVASGGMDWTFITRRAKSLPRSLLLSASSLWTARACIYSLKQAPVMENSKPINGSVNECTKTELTSGDLIGLTVRVPPICRRAVPNTLTLPVSHLLRLRWRRDFSVLLPSLS